MVDIKKRCDCITIPSNIQTKHLLQEERNSTDESYPMLQNNDKVSGDILNKPPIAVQVTRNNNGPLLTNNVTTLPPLHGH